MRFMSVPTKTLFNITNAYGQIHPDLCDSHKKLDTSDVLHPEKPRRAFERNYSTHKGIDRHFKEIKKMIISHTLRFISI